MHRLPQGGKTRLEDLTPNQLMSNRELWLSEVRALEREQSALRTTVESRRSSGTLDQGLELRMAAMDARVAAAHAKVASIDGELASRAGVSAERQARFAETRQPDRPAQPGFPEELIAIPVLFILCVGMPLAIAYARRIWRRTDAISTGVPHEIMDRLNRMDQNIDAIALEVERIGESQRFLAKQTEKEKASLKG